MKIVTPEVMQAWADCPSRAQALTEVPRTPLAEEVCMEMVGRLAGDNDYCQPSDVRVLGVVRYSAGIPTGSALLRLATKTTDSLDRSVRSQGVKSLGLVDCPVFRHANEAVEIRADGTVASPDRRQVWLWRFGELPHRYEVGTLALAAGDDGALAGVHCASVSPKDGIATAIYSYVGDALAAARRDAMSILGLISVAGRWENPLSRNCTRRRCPRYAQCVSVRHRREVR